MGQGSSLGAVQPPNRKCKIFVGILIAMFCLQILIAVGAFVVVDIPNGIFAVLFLFLLFMSWRYLQYTTLMMYMVCSIVVYIMALVYVLGIVQNGTNVCPNLKDCAKFALNIAFFVYYFAASIMTFFIYRQFKAVAFEKNPQLARFFPPQASSKPVPNVSENNIFTLGNFAPTYGAVGAREQPLPPPQLHVINPPNQANMTFAGQQPYLNQTFGQAPQQPPSSKSMSNKSITNQTTLPTALPNQSFQPAPPPRPNNNTQIGSGRSFRLPWTQQSQREMKSKSQVTIQQPTVVNTSQKEFKPFKGKGVVLG